MFLLLLQAGVVTLAIMGLPQPAATVEQHFDPTAAHSSQAVDYSLPPSAGSKETPRTIRQVQPRNPRVLFITSQESAQCAAELARLTQPSGDFESMRSRGWKIGVEVDNHLQIVDQAEAANVVQQLEVRDFPIVVCINGSEIVRSFRSGCTTPLDAWTLGWLAKGINERPQAEVPEAARVETTGNYPLRGNHWSIDGDVSPSREKVISHLRGAVHASQIKPTYQIESWSYEELRALHDNLHELEMGGVQYTNRPVQATSSFKSASSKALGR